MIHDNNHESQLRRAIEQKDKRLADQDQELLNVHSELQETRQDLAAAMKKSRKCEHQEASDKTVIEELEAEVVRLMLAQEATRSALSKAKQDKREEQANCRKLLEELQQYKDLNEKFNKVITWYEQKARNWDGERMRYQQTIYSLRTEYPLALLSQEREEQLSFLTRMMGGFDKLTAKRAAMRDTIRDIHNLTHNAQFNQ